MTIANGQAAQHSTQPSSFCFSLFSQERDFTDCGVAELPTVHASDPPPP
jgi:hypothetical protein